jgi:Kef-type K+ transport system membrane component KefB
MPGLALPAFSFQFMLAAMSAPIDPIASLLLSLAIVLISAKVGGHVAARIRQPPVLGELAAGLVLGNLTLVGYSGLDYLKIDPSLDMLSRLGVIILLFQVGLGSTVAQMRRVGLSSFLVAALGVAGPFVLGWGIGSWLLPGAGLYAHLFLGATLTATSVGITARVLKDLGMSQTDESRIVLGAAVIDDVEGLVILAVITGIVAAANDGRGLSYAALGLVLIKAGGFLVGALVLGVYLSPKLFLLASKLDSSGALLAVGLTFCFVLAWLAGAVGLAPIVGAFAAGLVLEDLHYRNFVERGEYPLDRLVEPIGALLIPIFFVVMGARTDLRVFASPAVVGLAAALTVAAVAGKLLCAFGVLSKGVDRLSVAIGMIPRGEVGLIFANIGVTLVVAGKPVVDTAVSSAVVIMVMATTAMTPPALKWSFSRRARAAGAADRARTAARLHV